MIRLWIKPKVINVNALPKNSCEKVTLPISFLCLTVGLNTAIRMIAPTQIARVV